MQGLLAQAVIYLAAIVIAVPLARRLGLGSVLGYLLAGMIVGPILGLVQHNESEDLLHYAEFGVVMMLFLIGLELEQNIFKPAQAATTRSHQRGRAVEDVVLAHSTRVTIDNEFYAWDLITELK